MFGLRMLPYLTAVKFNFLEAEPAARPTLADADLRSLVECCPCLAELDLSGAVMAGADMSSLKQLSDLIALVVGGAATHDRIAEGLAQLSCLKRLSIVDLPASSGHWADDGSGSDSDADVGAGDTDVPKFSFKALQQLLQLTQLTSLTLSADCCLFGGRYWREEERDFRAPVSDACVPGDSCEEMMFTLHKMPHDADSSRQLGTGGHCNLVMCNPQLLQLLVP
jgi:hypothetical protein